MTTATAERDARTTNAPGAVAAARMIRDLADVLIPGADGWPSAGEAGVQYALASRLTEERGEAALAGLVDRLLAAGAPFEGEDDERRTAIVERFEREASELFGWVRDAVFVAYYESPLVAQAINAKGHPYKLRPHLEGYALPPFDEAKDRPRHGRGAFVATDAVRPVDTSALDLADERTTTWGRKR